MMISFSHKFIFVRNYKVAGTSVKNVLLPYQPFYLRNRYIHYALMKGYQFGFRPAGYVLPIHSNALEIRARLPKDIYDGFFKFGFVRNPWDWQVSLYFFGLKQINTPHHHIIKGFKSFDEYIEWRVLKAKKYQKDFFSDENGNIIVDFIGKFENLGEDLKYICDKVNIRDCELPHLNQTRHKDYRDYYSDRSAQMVADHFKKDIDFFNYSFDA